MRLKKKKKFCKHCLKVAAERLAGCLELKMRVLGGWAPAAEKGQGDSGRCEAGMKGRPRSQWALGKGKEG